MKLDKERLRRNGAAYADSKGIAVDFQAPFGEGQDGTVWPTSRGSALKLFYRPANYEDERNCYLILQAAAVEKVGCLNVPKLVDYDDSFLAIEMGMIKPPRLLDFGKVHLHRPPPYWDDQRIMARFHGDGFRDFGEHWPEVLAALGELQQLGIYYTDPKIGNILFGDEKDDDDWAREPELDYGEYEDRGADQ